MWLLLPLTVLGALTLGAPAILVEGTANCPTAEQVRQELSKLEPPGGGPPPAPPPPSPPAARVDQAPAAGPPDAVRVGIDTVDGELRVRLRGGAETLAEKRFQAGPSCLELATAAAVVIAAWEADLASGVLLTPGLPPPLGPGPAVSKAPPAPIEAPPGRLRYELAAGFVASFAGAGFAPGGTVEAALGLGRWPLWARLAVTATSTRAEQVGTGEVSWTRVGFGLGPSYLGLRGAWRIEAHLLAVAGLIAASGSGFVQTAGIVDFDPGLRGGLRLGRRLAGGTALFVGASALGWPGRQRLHVNGVARPVEPSRLEGLLSLGVSFGRY